MSDQSTGVSAGTLSGVNLAGEDEAPDAALPAEDERTLAESATAPEDDPGDAATMSLAGDGEPAPDPQPTPDPAPAEETAAETPAKKGALSRSYVVLKEEKFDDGSPYTVKVHEVIARNAQNAMRKAFKDLSAGQEETTEATLVVIPASMYRPTVVRLNKTERVSVSFG